MRAAFRHPLFWILAAAAGLRLAGLFWGLPASDGWDDDGFAPRNFLTALALTYKPGSYFTYPPLHAFLLALLGAPGIVIAVQRKLGIPVKLVGLGEGPDDLAPFEPKIFVDALLAA